MDEPGPHPARCPHCRAAIDRPEARSCWLCGQALDRPAPPGRAPAHSAAARHAFRLSPLLLVVALVAVILGVAHEAPGLGIALAVAIAPALAWTVVVVSRNEARQGRPLPLLEKVVAFVSALAAVALIGLSAVFACFVTCLADNEMRGPTASSWPHLVAGGMTAVLVGIIAHLRIRQPWRRTDR